MLPDMRVRQFVTVLLLLASPLFAWCGSHRQETGFLNRMIVVNGTLHRYQVYLPEQWSPKQSWPVILFLHGSGERGSEGMDETQIGLPAAIRLHPERWPFVVVMPQVPFNHHTWTDADMMQMALDALAAEVKEFHGDTQRIYLTGMSLGGYGVWELARLHPHLFAAAVPVCGGVFWSYAPERWKETQLPAEYARSVGRLPLWIFHGAEDNVVSVKQARLLYDAVREAGGNVRYWEYAGWRHNAWDKAYAEPELPRWLLAHTLRQVDTLPPFAERVAVPIHPPPAHVNTAVYDAYVGDYIDLGVLQISIYRQGDSLYSRDRVGTIRELLPENETTFFYATGGTPRLTFDREPNGGVRGVFYRDDRHEDFWERKR